MRTIALTLLALSFFPLHAATYYVRTDGSNSNDGLTNSAGGAWLTVDYAADNVSANDTVRIQAGTYEETVTPGVSGTSGNMITFVADGEVIIDNIQPTGRSYLRFIGLTIDPTTTGTQENGCVSFGGTNSYIEFWNNTFRNGNANGIRMGTSVRLNNSLIIGNSFSTFGVGNGGGVGINLYGDDNLVAHNTITNCHPDGVAMKGSRNRVINLYAYAFTEDSGGHADALQFGSSTTQELQDNLFEAWFYVGTSTDVDNHLIQISNSQGTGAVVDNNVFRNLVTHETGSGHGCNQATQQDITHTIVYNTTEVELMRTSSVKYSWTMIGTGVNNSTMKNNLFYESWTTSSATDIQVVYSDSAWLDFDYNLAYDPDGAVTFTTSWSNQTNEQSNADPDFDNVANDDFTLGASSNATDNAGPITLVNEPSDTTGTTFTVDNGKVFRGDNTAIDHYSGNLVIGDTITIGTDTRTITSISGNDITVDSSLTWADDDPVYWGDDTTPDIGAYPYAGGRSYDLTATLRTGNPNTVTVSDSDLVRWVVWFEDGIPVEVDNASPYEYTDSGGTVTANAYRLFASKNPVVEAIPPTALLNVSGTITVGP